jgi:ribosomal protein S5
VVSEGVVQVNAKAEGVVIISCGLRAEKTKSTEGWSVVLARFPAVTGGGWQRTQGTCSAVVGSEDGQVGEGINDADRSKLCREGGSIGRGGSSEGTNWGVGVSAV